MRCVCFELFKNACAEELTESSAIQDPAALKFKPVAEWRWRFIATFGSVINKHLQH